MITSFAQIIAPITPEEFYRDYMGKKWLHIPGAADKFASMMTWEKLNHLLDMDIWTQTSLKLFLDKRGIPADAYCRPKVGRNHQQVVAPHQPLVRDWLKKGATLILDEVETLNPGLASAMRALEAGLGANVAMNLYCSFREKKAFESHFDKHDVWAFHFEGEKLWHIYENMGNYPIEHAAFQKIPQAHFDQAKGRMIAEFVMRPGDLLYLPRGVFHDALCISDGCVHIACGVTQPMGLNWLSRVWELAVADPAFRMDLPRLDEDGGHDALREHIDLLRRNFHALLDSDEAFQQALALRKAHSVTPAIALPGDGPDRRFKVWAETKLVRRGKSWALKTPQGSREVTDADSPPLEWIAERGSFDSATFAQAFPALSPQEREALFDGLTTEGVLTLI